MKSLSKFLINTLVILFCAGAITSVYVLYKLPEHIIAQTPAVNFKLIEQISPVLFRLYWMLGATLSAGVVTITSLLVFRTSRGHQRRRTEEAQYASAIESTTEQAAEQSVDLQNIGELLGIQDKEELFTKALSVVCTQLEASQAAAYEVKHDDKHRFIQMFASYAHFIPEGDTVKYRFGEGITGQVAKDGRLLNIKAVPDGYLPIVSGLGKATPKYLLVLPIKYEEKIAGVVEIASFKEFTGAHERALQQWFDKLSLKLANNDNVSLAEANV